MMTALEGEGRKMEPALLQLPLLLLFPLAFSGNVKIGKQSRKRGEKEKEKDERERESIIII